MAHGAHAVSPRRVPFGEKLVLGDLGDGTGGAGLLAGAAGHAGVLVLDGGNVLELENVAGAGVDADAAGDALVSVDNGMGHDDSLHRDFYCREQGSSGLKVSLGNLSTSSFR